MIDKILGSILGPVNNIIDELKFSGEEKGKLKTKINGQILGVIPQILEYERNLIAEKASIIRSELSDGNWFSKSWRPFVMIVFTFLLVTSYLGLTTVKESLQIELLGIIKFGLSGYIVGRSAEKIVGKGLDMLSNFKTKQ